MYRFSNTLIGFLNLFTLLASIPIIGGGLWMARSSTTCESFLQTPLLVVGFVVLIISLAGFIGACFQVAWALWVYLVVMLFLIASLMGLTIFGFVVTGEGGGGVGVPGRAYKEYRLQDYSPWLKQRVEDGEYWRTIRSCILGSKTCAKLASWTPLDYMDKDMSPIQSGCCKPPTACNYNMATLVAQDPDCYKWNNSPTMLCYECDSCKAGVLESVRRDWHKLSVLNIVMLVLLIGIYSIGCCAFRNTRRAETDYPYGENRMTKVRPRWDYYWSVSLLISLRTDPCSDLPTPVPYTPDQVVTITLSRFPMWNSIHYYPHRHPLGLSLLMPFAPTPSSQNLVVTNLLASAWSLQDHYP